MTELFSKIDNIDVLAQQGISSLSANYLSKIRRNFYWEVMLAVNFGAAALNFSMLFYKDFENIYVFGLVLSVLLCWLSNHWHRVNVIEIARLAEKIKTTFPFQCAHVELGRIAITSLNDQHISALIASGDQVHTDLSELYLELSGRKPSFDISGGLVRGHLIGFTFIGSMPVVRLESGFVRTYTPETLCLAVFGDMPVHALPTGEWNGEDPGLNRPYKGLIIEGAS